MTEHNHRMHGDSDARGPDTLRREVAFYRDLVAELERRNDVQKILNEILRLSLQPTPLNEQLGQILRLILSLEWLALEKKGAFFIKMDGADALRLVAHQNLGEPLLKMCHRVDFGRCLCGRAALDKKLIFKSCLDHEHENRPGKVSEHGHYVVPILANDALLGVLNLYVKHGHDPTEEERAFLTACSHVIAGVLVRKKIEDQLVHLSMHDGLTKLPNRRALYQHIEDTAKRLKRTRQAMALMFIDLDYFKAVNDAHGHQIGDEILTGASDRIRQSLREYDFTARVGGDEFVAVLECAPETGEEQVRRAAVRLIEAVSRPYDVGHERLRIGASVGVYLYLPADGQEVDAEALIMKADKAMYQAKAARGTVHILSAA
jgi:diguanylate cyclase (GGDEF)-like protein